MSPQEKENLFAKIHAIEIVLVAVCTQLRAQEASSTLNIIHRMIGSMAEHCGATNMTTALMNAITSDLAAYQKVLIAQTCTSSKHTSTY